MKLICVGRPPKKKRGVVVGAKTKEMTRNEPEWLIEVEWDDELDQPAKKSIGGQMTHDIESKVKDEVPMKAAVYGDLDLHDKGIMYDYTSVSCLDSTGSRYIDVWIGTFIRLHYIYGQMFALWCFYYYIWGCAITFVGLVFICYMF